MKQLKQNILLSFLCAILFWVILWSAVPPVYGVIDDLFMRRLVSGQLLGYPDPHTVFIGYWFSLFLAGLYKVQPNIDWYALCFMIVQSGCVGLICYRYLEKRVNCSKIRICAIIILLCFCLGVRFFAQITFTTTAAIPGVTAIFWYMSAEKEMKMSDYMILFWLCFLTAEIRFSILIMIIPIGAGLWLVRFIESGKQKSHVWVPLIVISAVLFCFLGWFIGYRGTEWEKYNQFNHARSQIYDYSKYKFLPYMEEKDFYDSFGIVSENQVDNLKYNNYTADENVSMDFFVQYYSMRQEAIKRERQSIGPKVIESMVLYLKAVLLGNYGYDHLLTLFGYGVFLIFCIKKKEWRECIAICVLGGTQAVIWVYMVYQGRMPKRVLMSMNLLLIVSLLPRLVDTFARWKLLERHKHRICAFCGIALCITAFFNIMTVREENLSGIRSECKEEVLNKYCSEHPESFYFIDSASLPRDFCKINFWEEPLTMNYTKLGGWIVFSPMWKEKLRQNGIFDVEEALCEKENVFFICNSAEKLKCLCGLYDKVTYEKEDELMDCIIYRLRIDQGTVL